VFDWCTGNLTAKGGLIGGSSQWAADHRQRKHRTWNSAQEYVRFVSMRCCVVCESTEVSCGGGVDTLMSFVFVARFPTREVCNASRATVCLCWKLHSFAMAHVSCPEKVTCLSASPVICSAASACVLQDAWDATASNAFVIYGAVWPFGRGMIQTVEWLSCSLILHATCD
jgi:hypothetical protein